MYTISVLRNKYEHDSKIITIASFNKIKTSKTKKDAPLWCFSERTQRHTPFLFHGFVIDIDIRKVEFKSFNVNTSLTYFYHETYNKGWRIIIPFNEAIKINVPQYKKAYYACVNDLNIIKDDVDSKCSTSGAWFFWIPSTADILKNEGMLYTPKLIPQVSDIIFSIPKKLSYIDDKYLIKKLLIRINNFYSYYKTKIKWGFIKSPQCQLNIHDTDTKDDIDFNLPSFENGYKANIYCHHLTCYERLKLLLDDFQPQSSKIKKIVDYTPLYLTKIIIDGVVSIDQIEACGIDNHIIKYLNRLNYMSFNAKIDTPVWLKYLHSNMVYHYQTIYEYKEGYYQDVIKDELKYFYHEHVGTYVGYRSGIKTKPYIEEMIEYANAEFLFNYKHITHEDGICLNNGVLLFEGNNKWSFNAHNKNYFLTNKQNFRYDKDVIPHLWYQTLIDYFDDLESTQVTLLQEFFGYCLTYDDKFEKFLVMFGESRGGKNTIAETLIALIGGCSASFYLLANPEKRYFIVGKKVIFINEVVNCNNERNMNELKKLVSTEPLPIRPLYDEAFTLEKKPKIVMCFNDAPNDLKMDTALKNRMLALKFTKSFAGKENPYLKEQLLNELPGIMNWALQGYDRLCHNKKFISYDEASDELYGSANEGFLEVKEFINEIEKKDYLPVDLLEKYMEYSGNYKISNVIFGRYVKKLGYKKVTSREHNFRKIYRII